MMVSPDLATSWIRSSKTVEKLLIGCLLCHFSPYAYMILFHPEDGPLTDIHMSQLMNLGQT